MLKRNREIVGNTPLIKINYLYNNEERHLYAKLEYFNVTGSIKDRLVYYVLDKEKSKPKMLVEATSGNTGISLAAYGAKNKIPVHIFMPDFVSIERGQLLKLYGANVHLVSREDGGFIECVKQAKEFSLKNNAYLFNQFSNKENINCHYNTTALEIVRDLKHIDKFVSGIGTGGTLMGCARRLKEKYGSKIIALEPASLPILTDKNACGNHQIDGIGDDFIPDIVDFNYIDEIVRIDDKDAINMAIKLGKELGLGVGVSSGANFLASVISSDENEEVVTIFVDDNKKYLSTFSKDNEIDDSFISNKIELISYELVN